jgi:hypothetical protein
MNTLERIIVIIMIIRVPTKRRIIQGKFKTLENNLMKMDVHPTVDRFIFDMDTLPHGIRSSPENKTWFLSSLNSDIRKYYRLIRTDENTSHSHPIGKTGITMGELALYIIRTNHSKRRKRY